MKGDMKMETKGAFMISTEEYWQLLYAKARLELLKETYEKYCDAKYGVVTFVQACERTFREMDAEKEDVK